MDIRSSVAPMTLAAATALLSCSAFAAQATDAPEKNSTAMSTAADAENTRINERDRNDTTTLPTDQPNNSADLEVAAAVRAAIVEDDSLSMTAHNVKLVAAGGVVVLRGPVESATEKAKVAQIAGSVPGVSKVENRLEISTP
ncbi:MAG: BON domain-containing protein [Dokdonella sp.]